MTDPERHAYADWHVRHDAAQTPPGSSLNAFLRDHDAMAMRYEQACVENTRMRAELTARSAA